MKNIIEYEVYRYSQRLVECYDESGKLKLYPVRKPMQCIVLMNLTKNLSPDVFYSGSSISDIILKNISFDGIETILEGLIEYGFVTISDESGDYCLDKAYKEHYLNFLGLF